MDTIINSLTGIIFNSVVPFVSSHLIESSIAFILIFFVFPMIKNISGARDIRYTTSRRTL